MNLIEEFVTNITYVSDPDEDGLRKVTADYNCYGHKKEQATKYVSELEWKMIQEKGYRLC